MVDLNESLVGFVSATVSSIDGRPYTTVTTPAASAGFGTMGELLHKLLNRIDSPSATLISGGVGGSVAISLPSSVGNSAIRGTIQGVPFMLTNIALSGMPTSAASTGSTTIRKVLVCLAVSALPVASSLDAAAGTVQFVYSSAFGTSGGAVLSGGQSAYFNSVPLPKAHAGQIPVGWLNIPNSFAQSAGISASMMITDPRETRGVNLSAFYAPQQP